MPQHADVNPAFEQECADLIGDTGALPDQPLAHAMQRCRSSRSEVLVATNFMVGHCTASTIARPYRGARRQRVRRARWWQEALD
jgi:hypothetical protein